ncbi:hypothetical protein K3X44_11045 [Aliiroseovarius crassostreae]|uniref:hypothetical protein n=1 Tax=Aliiroseovarius crassostreae TaxID=154981 RepID=UPI00220B020F|nr:hypothetical protein [Aliiroseovarius crassostreae]UWQ01033.1 hypothetical protein K3X44_11045 [Aliiroseovarius crassostreae]
MNESKEIREIFFEAIKSKDDIAALIFQEYSGLEFESNAHFESRFDGEASGFITEIIGAWKNIQPLLGGTADIAGIAGLIITVRQNSKSKKSDEILKDIQKQLEKMEDVQESE